MINKYRWL